nr:DUF2703 domain-containing protein [bacterium]
MAKNWYPVIDILTCIECGTCVNFCSHGVYDKSKAPAPVVIYPDGCIDHCHGCGNKCPMGAIAYVGDDTGWAPPAQKEKTGASDCNCGCSCSSETKNASKRLTIEYLYLDLCTCDRCIGTDAVLEEVISVLRPALELAGYTVDYRKYEMATAEIAKQYHFLSSPTIRVNGTDIFGNVQESDCTCCGDIAGVAVDCRVFEYDGKKYEVPTKEMLANAILKHLDAIPGCSCTEYALPENLRRFYAGKESKAASTCSCGCSCC